MTAHAHSLKHAKAEFQRFQSLAIASALLTIVTIILAAVTSFQVAHLGRAKTQAVTAAQNRADEMLQRETAALKERLGAVEHQLIPEKAIVQQLTSTLSILQKQLSGFKSAGNGVPKQKPLTGPFGGSSNLVEGPNLPTTAP